MARISVWYVRAALLHFAVGATLGAWGLGAKSGLLPPVPLPVRSLHVEVVLIGWVCQLAVGVALWILPFSRSVSEDGRFWTAWVAMNVGIVLAVGGRLVDSFLLLILGRGAEGTAALLLIVGLWPRLRPLSQRRH